MALVIQEILKRQKVNTTVLQFLKACFNIFAFIVLCILCFGHIEGHDWWNQPVTGWDENKTDESWGVYLWNWDWIDCMYFAMVTMCTVGYGDMPTLPQGLRIFNIFFATLGVIFVAGSITTIVNFFAEQGRKRFILKQRMLIEDAHRAAELVKQQQRDGADRVPEPPPSPPADERAYEKAEESQPKYPIWDRLIWSRLPKRKNTLKVLAALRPTGAFFCLCIILGELENSQIEGCGGFGAGWRCGGNTGCDEWKLSHELGGFCWSWIDSFYYGFITYLTVGYGDVAPKTKGGKALGTLLVTMGLFSFTALLAELADIQAQARLGAEKTLQERLIELNEVIDQDDNGKVTADEYIIFNLKKMGKVDDMTITLLKDQFKALDADGSGELDADDISLLTQAAEQVENEERSARHQEVS